MSTGLAEQEKTESELNPGQEHQDSLTDMSAFENSFKNDTADSSQEDRNIKKAKNKEEAAGKNNTQPPAPGKKGKSETLASSKTPSGGSKAAQALKFAKKTGPLAPILIIFIISGSFLGAISTVGLAFTQMSESLKSSLDDALSPSEKRFTHVMRAKTKNKILGTGCKTGSPIRCKYKTMSEKQMDKMRKAGFTFEPDPPKKNAAGRYRISALVYTDENGKKVRVEPKNMQRHYEANKHFRSLINTANNPKFKALRSAWATKAFGKFKVTFTDKLGGKSQSEMRNTHRQVVRDGGTGGPDINRNRGDREGDSEETKNERQNSEDKAREQLAKQRSGSISGRAVMANSLRGVNLFTGAQEAMCTIARTAELASHASRLLQYGQLMRYASLFFTAADKIKLGDQTHEEMEYLGGILLHSDMREKVINEDSYVDEAGGSIFDVDFSSSNSGPEVDLDNLAPVSNPDYRKNALDSAGMKTAMYGSPTQHQTNASGTGADFDSGRFQLSNRESQFVVGSGFGHVVDSTIKTIRSIPGLGRSGCAFWENEFVAGAGLLASVALAVVSGGGSLVGSGVKAAAQIAVVTLIMALINAKIADMLSADNLSDETKGIDAGNAWFSGAGALFGVAASSRGITPASTQEEIRSMESMRTASRIMEAKVARYEARDTPFDILNQYSFLGSIAWNISPANVSASSGLKTFALAPLQILSSVSTSFMSDTVSANIDQSQQSKERFSQCSDPNFTGGNLFKNGDDNLEKDATGINLQTADIMCNIRYTDLEMNLNADPERVADWMVDAAQVDPESGAPITDAATMEELHNNRTSAQEVSTAAVGENPGSMNVVEPPEEVYPSRPRSGDQSNITRPIDMTVAEVMRPDDDTLAYLGIPLDTPSEKLAQFNPGMSNIDLANSNPAISTVNVGKQRYLPPPISESAYNYSARDDYNPEKDVRTYAHWYRYCRYGPEDGREVPIGMADDAAREGLFDMVGMGIIKQEYINDGRECLRSNNCKAGQDPNGNNWYYLNDDSWGGEKVMRNRCRPPQYDIYSIYYLDLATEEGFEEDDATGGESNGVTGEWVYPTDREATTETSPFGPRGGTEHRGMDIAGPEGTPLYAARDGKVTAAGAADGFGQWIIIQHEIDGEQVDTVYGHMWPDGVLVKEGDEVKGGDHIGDMGNNGQSSGPHLHFEIWEGGRLNGGTAVDPAPMLEGT